MFKTGEESKAFGKKIDASRKISRDAIYRITLLSAGIVGFSVSLFSVPIFQSSLDFNILQYSWYFFLGVIILGFFILMFEGRIEYAISWKGFQPMQLPNKQCDYTIKEIFCADLIVIVTFLYPGNLFFNRIYENIDEIKFKERVNGLVVQKLAASKNHLIFLENIIFALFVAGLILLVTSIN